MTAVTVSIAVYSMYWLFSQMNTTGSAHTAARLSASWKAPMLVAPSPKKQTVTWPVPRYCADHAAPLAITSWAPTIAYEPSTPLLTSSRCMEPPLPRIRPFSRPSSSAMTGVIGVPRASTWLWPR